MIEPLVFFDTLLSPDGFIPRWVCGEWTDFHGWATIIADGLIWLSYSIIPIALLYYVVKRKDATFRQVFWWFIAFILFCGATHLLEVIIFYIPLYRLSTFFKIITAFVSLITAGILVKKLPYALSAKSVDELELIVKQRTQSLQKANEQLEVKNRQLEDFSYIASHNLRSPVGNLMSLMEMCSQSPEQASKEQYLQMSMSVVGRLNNTIGALGELVKMEQPTAQSSEKIKVAALIEENIEMLKPHIQKQGARVLMSLEVEYIIFPKIYISSAIYNLLSNALKYAREGVAPEVHFKTFMKNDQVVLTCSDNGQGIDLDKHGKTLFTFGKTFHHNKDAQGVGLYMTKRQIESMGGKIEVQSTPGKGTTFSLFIPKQNPN